MRSCPTLPTSNRGTSFNLRPPLQIPGPARVILPFLGAVAVLVVALDPVAGLGVLGSLFVLWRIAG